MKNRILALLCFVLLAVIVALTGGCAAQKPAPADNAKQLQLLCYDAANLGTVAALLQNPTYRPAFETAYTSLDETIKAGTITDVSLHKILAQLPIQELKSPEVTIGIAVATTVYHRLTKKQIQIGTDNQYAVAAALGIRDGLGAALGK